MPAEKAGKKVAELVKKSERRTDHDLYRTDHLYESSHGSGATEVPEL